MEFIIKTNDEVAGLDISEALSLSGIQHTILSKQRDSQAELDILQARLTLTEAALSAAGELLMMSTAKFHGTDSAFVKCDYCGAETWSGHEENCEYRLTEDTYATAREALNGNETK